MSKKLNIVHLVPALGVGGAEKIIVQICRKGNRQFFNTTVLYWGKDEALLKDLRYTGTKVVKLDLKNPVSWDSVKSCVKVLKDLNADVLHTHFIDADLLGFFAASRLRIPWVIDIHSYPFPQKFTHCLRYRFLSCFCRRILCVSETVKKYVMSKTGISDKKLSVVCNGIDIKNFQRKFTQQENSLLKQSLGLGVEDVTVGNISRLIPDKGQQFLIEAMPAVLKKVPQAKLLIVGDGELKDVLVQRTKDLNIRDKVIFTGTRHDIVELLNIMDVFVFPTFREALGITVIEAMAAGKPIIATNDAAIPELIKDKEDGLLIEPGDSTKIADAIMVLLQDSSLARQISQNAQRKVANFSDDAMVEKIQRIYQEIGGS